MEIEKKKFFAATLQEQIKMINELENFEKEFDQKENQKRKCSDNHMVVRNSNRQYYLIIESIII